VGKPFSRDQHPGAFVQRDARWFARLERYVPRTLVMRLVKEGRVGFGSEERVLAIMFTDIASFTSMCETMSAGEVAAFINQHLSLVSACVEQAGGTIDKFIGDAVMAFWGAPGRVENPAASACRAAVAIQHALAADNKRRAAEGLAPVRIRIGIHMGPVVVGDIGAPNRINYTIVGDTVNAAQRLESLGKTVDPNAEAITLVSPKSLHQCRRASSSSSGAPTSSKASKSASMCISLSANTGGNGRLVQRLITHRHWRARGLAIGWMRVRSQEVGNFLDGREKALVLLLFRRRRLLRRRRRINGSNRPRFYLDRCERLGPDRSLLRGRRLRIGGARHRPDGNGIGGARRD
jgi:class 3 adenylate cyclase